jgi:hypothetical protein
MMTTDFQNLQKSWKHRIKMIINLENILLMDDLNEVSQEI